MIEAHTESFEALRRVVTEADSERIVYVQFPGNAGDALITDGTYQFLDSLNVGYTTDYTDAPGIADRDYRDATVLLGGGGNLVPIYRHARTFLDSHLGSVHRLIVLPHTIRGQGDLLRRMGTNCTVFCREQASFEHCLSVGTSARIERGHDMAFFWSAEANAVARRTLPPSVPESYELVRYLLKSRSRHARYGGSVEKGVLNAYRIDDESTEIERPPGNVDLSSLLLARRNSKTLAAAVVGSLIRFLEKADTVRTNRLHISILAAFLDLDVRMHDNSYGKNRTIYEHSMAGHFDNVRFV